MKRIVKELISTRFIIICILALCMLPASCQTESSSELLPEASKTIEQETIPTNTETSVVELTESPPEPMPESSEITEQETPAVSSISVDELKDKLEGGSPITLVDIRNRDDFLTNHIKGAVSIPLDEIPDRYQDIPKDREVIVYADCA